MARLVSLFLVFLATPVFAWEVRHFDDGSFFVTDAYTDQGVSILCGERSPRGISPPVTGNTEPEITDPGELRIEIDSARIGTSTQERNDLMFVVGTTGYRLPTVQYNELFGRWQVDLPASDPVFRALAGQTAFELRGEGVSIPVPGVGFDETLAGLTGHCQKMFAAIGKHWPGDTVAPVAMRAAAEADILNGCGGLAVKSGAYLLPAEIDGDGIEDVVLDWNGITCQGAPARPFCGAAHCSADIYLSSAYGRTGRPEQFLAIGVGLVPLSNGNSGVTMGMSISECQNDGCYGLVLDRNGARAPALRRKSAFRSDCRRERPLSMVQLADVLRFGWRPRPPTVTLPTNNLGLLATPL